MPIIPILVLIRPVIGPTRLPKRVPSRSCFTNPLRFSSLHIYSTIGRYTLLTSRHYTIYILINWVKRYHVLSFTHLHKRSNVYPKTLTYMKQFIHELQDYNQRNGKVELWAWQR